MRLLGIEISRNMKKFFSLLRRQLFLILFLVLSFLVIISSFAFIGTGVRELLKQNADTLLILALDLVTESGPDYKERSKEYAWMTHQFVDHMENSRFSPVVRILFPRFSLEERLEPVIEALEMARDENEARKAIAEAGEEIVELYIDAEKFAQGPVVWPKYEELPDELLHNLHNAIEESRVLVTRFERDASLKNAINACQANRKTMLLLYLARMGNYEKARIIEFQRNVRQACEHFIRLYATVEDDERIKALLLRWIDSEQRRVKILDAMVAGDMYAARHLLTEAIDKAFKEKYGMSLDE